MRRISRVPNTAGSLRLAIIAAALVCTLVPAPTTRAQGTAGSLPDPISSRELTRYAERLKLSDEQHQALHRFHEQYRVDFARLRDREIEEFLDEHGGFGGFNITFDRAVIRDRTRALKDILDRIRSLDRQLFDQLSGVLTDEQMGRLSRVRKARQRARCQTDLTFFPAATNPIARIDLSVLVEELKLPPQVMEGVDPLLTQYEGRLTNAARELHEASIHMGEHILNRMEQQPPAGSEADEQQRAMQSIGAMFAAMTDVAGQLGAQSAQIAALNRRTVKALSSAMPAEDAERLRMRFYERSAPEVASVLARVRYRFETALDQEQLDDEQREGIRALRTGFRARRDSLAEQAMDLLEDQQRGGFIFNMSDEDREKRRKLGERGKDLRERGLALAEETMQGLDVLLGEDLARRVQRHVDARMEDEREQQPSESMMMVTIGTMADGDGEGVTSFSMMTASVEGGDLTGGGAVGDLLPGPISRAQVARCAGRLKLTDDERSIAQALHDEYLSRFEQVKHEEIGAARQAAKELWPADFRDEDAKLPTVSDVENVYRLRRQAATAIQAADAQFFDDLSIVAGDDERAAMLERLRAQRRRQLYTHQGGSPGGGLWSGGGGGVLVFGFAGGNEEGGVDLAAVVEGLDLSDETLAELDATLLEYERRVTDVFQRSYEASLRIEEEEQKMRARSTRRTEEGVQTTISFDETAFQAVQQQEEARRQARLRIAELNRSTRETLMRMLEADDAERLRRAYNRKAFPSVYRDPKDPGPRLREALALPDLAPDQQAAVEALLLEHQAAYDELCEQMVATHAASQPAGGAGTGAAIDLSNVEGMQQRARDLERLSFERNDLNGRTLDRLRVILTDDQAARIGGLEAPGPDD